MAGPARPRRSLTWLVVGAAGALALAMVAGWAARAWWGFAILADLRLHLLLLTALVLVVVLAVGPIRRATTPRAHRSAVAVLLATVVVGAAVVVPRWTAAPPPVPVGAPTATVAHVNLQGVFGWPVVFQDWLWHTNDDVVVLLEQDEDLVWGPALTHLAPGYRRYRAPGGGGRSTIVARVPITDVHVPDDPDLPPATIAFTARLAGRDVEVLAVHTRSPGRPSDGALRDAALAAVARWAAARTGPALVVGDLNATPLSPQLQDLLADGGLADSSVGRGWPASWPSWAGPLGLPIDHSLSRGGLVAVDRRLGLRFGSQHRMLEVTYAVP